MAQFQLPPSKLFPGRTRLFVVGDSGQERLTLQIGKQVTLELVGLTSPSAKPTVVQVELQTLMQQVTVQSLMDLARLVVGIPAAPDVLSVSALAGGGTRRSFTVKALRAGIAALVSEGVSPLLIAAGDFKNHDGFDRDLIADVFCGSDSAKIHVLTRTLFSNIDNLFNEESEGNQRHWCSHYPPTRCLPCGSVAVDGSRAIFHASVNYDYQPYNKSIPEWEPRPRAVT
jgi:hypothetical protein